MAVHHLGVQCCDGPRAPEETRAAFAKSVLTAVTARNAPMGYLVLRVAAIRFGSGCLV